MTDQELATRLASLAPPMADADALIAAVRQRHGRERRTRALTAVTAGFAAVVVAGAVVAATADAPTGRPQQTSLGPACGFATPFTGFVPGTDSGEVVRASGTPATRLVARAGRGDFRLENLRIDVSSRGAVVRTQSFGGVPADGRELPIVVGDRSDAGAPIAPGRYVVTITADVVGRNNCGEQAWQRMDTIAGYLVVR